MSHTYVYVYICIYVYTYISTSPDLSLSLSNTAKIIGISLSLSLSLSLCCSLLHPYRQHHGCISVSLSLPVSRTHTVVCRMSSLLKSFFAKETHNWPTANIMGISPALRLSRSLSHTYNRLLTGWHRISRLFSKPFQRTRILPMGFTISTK